MKSNRQIDKQQTNRQINRRNERRW